MTELTSWQVGGLVLGLIAYAIAWIWGGRPERLAAGVLLFTCLLSSLTFGWEVGGFYWFAMAQDCVRLLIFGWLCLRFDRWWSFVITAALGQMLFVYAAQLLIPAVTQYAVASAHVGLGYLIDLALLLGVSERWLAGEEPARLAAWKAADRATAWRRRRRDGARLQETSVP
ncbi:hypothetical protein [Brevundimonas sp.]|uniref:hypothetical protein n=1 Tax=Brevundimonas sp. TaxID=1871086 RepID=UPI002D40A519|nr:hypothetical protein [Brevundimonas sp.]HYD28288.1 hypothetical protein [Brevundimonas sp.]